MEINPTNVLPLRTKFSAQHSLGVGVHSSVLLDIQINSSQMSDFSMDFL